MNGPIASAIAQTLFHFLWEGSLIGLALGVGLFLFRPSSSRIRYTLACCAMLAMLASFGATLASLWPHHGTVVVQSNAARHPYPVTPLFVWPDSPPATKGVSPLDWIAPFWIFGVFLFCLRSLTAWIAATRLTRTAVAPAPEIWRARFAQLAERVGVARPISLLESYLTDIPVVIGFLKPVILVPAQLFTGFAPEQLEFILIHELAHIRRHDYLVNLLQSLVEDLLFYHPAVWWVSSVIRAERENCCDDVVVAAAGNAHAFAEALTALEQHRWTVQGSGLTSSALAANGGHLMNRIQRLLEAGANRPRLASPSAFSASLLIAVGALAVSITHAKPAPQAPASQPAISQVRTPLPVTPAEVSIPVQPTAPLTSTGATLAPDPQPDPSNALYKMLLRQKRQIITREVTKQETQEVTRQIAQALGQDPATTREQNEQRLKKELETPYRKWLNEEVIYIISSEERRAFGALTTDAEREVFIEQFWLRRDPTPATAANEYQEEFYRRIAYADNNFGDRVPGWKTDRGMVYIKYGPPDEREQHAATTGVNSTEASEKWRYRYIEGVGKDVTIEFVDPTGTGDYHMTMDPSTKDALVYAPGAVVSCHIELHDPNPMLVCDATSPASAQPAR